MKIILTLAALIFVTAISISQTKAEKYFNAGYFSETISILEKKSDKKKSLSNTQKAMMAEAYFKLRDYEASKKLYKDLHANSFRDSLCLIRLIDLNRNFGNYDDASKLLSEYFSRYKARQEKSQVLKNYIEFPKNNSVVEEGVKIKPIDIPQTPRGMGYTFYKSNDLITGIHDTDENNKIPLVRLAKVFADSAYNSLEKFNVDSKIPFYNAYPSYDAKNDLLYYTANYTKKVKSGKTTENVLQIYVVDLKQSNPEPKRLSFNNSEYNFTHPFISEDGEQLFFTSDKNGGEGGFDVYYAKKEGDSWTSPINCGTKVNSPKDELTPSFLNNELYFSSYGHNNYGGSDIFKSEFSEEFSEPTNMGLPINSSKDEFSYLLAPDEDFALLTTNRFETGTVDDICTVSFAPESFLVLNEKTKTGVDEVVISINEQTLSTNENGEWAARIPTDSKLDITFDHPYYKTEQFTYEKIKRKDIDSLKTVNLIPIMISGRSVDDITGNPIEDVKISLYVKNGEEWELIDTQQTDGNGKWGFHVRKDKEYKVVQEKDKYVAHSEEVPRFDESEKQHKEVLTRMNPFSLKYNVEKDLVIEIDNIYFDFNSSILREESFPVLDKVKELLNDNEDIRIELSAHTDCIGKDKYNLWLSQRRAERSRTYLIENGISPNRIIAKGYGEQKMIVTDCELQKKDDKEAQKNRRVEVKIL